MYNFDELTKYDVDGLINDFCKMFEEFSSSVPDDITNDVMSQLLMSPEDYRNLGMEEIADAIEKVKE